PFGVAAELVRPQPDLIVTAGPETSLQAVVGASGFIPVVIIAVNFDPLARGYIPGLARPSNITGLVFQQLELARKQVELLTQAFPDRTVGPALRCAIGRPVRRRRAGRKGAELAGTSAAARKSAVRIPRRISWRRSGGAQMVLVLSSPFFLPHLARIVELANAQRLPSMFIGKHWAQAGGLMAYGADFLVMFRRAADYVAKILKGTKPADLPVEQATKFELVVNL